MNHKKYLPILAGLTFSVIFGFTFMFTKEGLEVISPFHLLGFRFALAAIIMSCLVLTGIIKINFKEKKLGALFLLATAQPGLYFIFETFGVNMTTSSEAGLMISLIPVVVTILAAIFLDEKPTQKQLFFIILSVAGVMFIELMKGTMNVKSNYLGLLVIFGAVLMGGLYNILSRSLSLSFKPVEITFVMVWYGSILFNTIAFIRKGGSIRAYLAPLTNIEVIIPIIYLSLFASVVAFFMMNYTLSKIQASQSAVFANLTTVVSILAGVLIRHEPFYWFQVVGAAMIIIGVWGTNYYGEIKKPIEEITG
jgi:drug/metabolite transporter (DMT)-like permease